MTSVLKTNEPIKITKFSKEEKQTLAEILPVVIAYRRAEKIKTSAEKGKSILFEILSNYIPDASNFNVIFDVEGVGEVSIIYNKTDRTFKTASDIEEEITKLEASLEQKRKELQLAKKGEAFVKAEARQKTFEITAKTQK